VCLGHAPERVRLLASMIHEVHVTGVDRHTLRIAVADGFHSHAADQLMRSGDDPLPVGHTVALLGMSITVVDHTAAGHVRTIDARLDKPLTDPSLLWFATRDHKPVAFTPPAPGETIVLPAAF
jgi:hypothetical protein